MWKFLGRTLNYVYWVFEDAGERYFNCTVGALPPWNSTGYYNLSALRERKNDTIGDLQPW